MHKKTGQIKSSDSAGKSLKKKTGTQRTKVLAKPSSKARVVTKKIKNSKPIVNTAVSPTGGQDEKKQIQPVRSGSANIGLCWAALALSVLALIAGGYAWYKTTVVVQLEAGQRNNRLDLIEQKVEYINVSLENDGKELDRIKMQASQIKTLTDMKIKQLVEQQQTLNQTVKSSLQLNQQRVQRWRFNEVEQLLIIANQKLQLAGDVVVAKQVLRLADQRLQKLAHPSVNKIRLTLATEISSLENIKTLDLVTVIGRIKLLMSNIKTLPLAGDVDSVDRTAVATKIDDTKVQPTSAADDSWFTTGKEFFQGLGNLIQIEKTESYVVPVLSLELRELTRQRLGLLLEMMQLTFLRQDQLLYLNRIKAVEEFTGRYFKTSDTKVQDWLDSLGLLKMIETIQDWPNISTSLQQLRSEIIAES